MVKLRHERQMAALRRARCTAPPSWPRSCAEWPRGFGRRRGRPASPGDPMGEAYGMGSPRWTNNAPPHQPQVNDQSVCATSAQQGLSRSLPTVSAATCGRPPTANTQCESGRNRWARLGFMQAGGDLHDRPYSMRGGERLIEAGLGRGDCRHPASRRARREQHKSSANVRPGSIALLLAI
jgi:hypothetical protein